ncbi:hypothetical protein SK128_001635, partial [Halocaridina rubra]
MFIRLYFFLKYLSANVCEFFSGSDPQDISLRGQDDVAEVSLMTTTDNLNTDNDVERGEEEEEMETRNN